MSTLNGKLKVKHNGTFEVIHPETESAQITDFKKAIINVLPINTRTNSTAYAVGDCVYARNLPSWAYLRCTKAGTTADSLPSEISSSAALDQTITDGSVVWIVSRLGTPADKSIRDPLSLIKNDPTVPAYVPHFYAANGNFTAISSSNHVSIAVPTKIQINVNDKGYASYPSSQIILNINTASTWDTGTAVTAANRKGKDYYIYAVIKNDDLSFLVSANSTVPTGYTAATSRKVGGFHCLCADVGTISGHPLSGYVAGDILPTTVWDLKHRPVSSPEGMAFVDGLNLWFDIYLAGWDGSKLISKFGASIVDGGSASPKKMHGEAFAENYGLIKKRLCMRDEFMVAAKGSNECTSIEGSTDPGTTGGHVDTASRRTISNYGLEDCCGVLWQWTGDLQEYMPATTTICGPNTDPNWNGYYLDGYSWQDGDEYSPTYNKNVDSQKYGGSYGFLRRLLAGGRWDDGSHCGSRSVIGNDASASASWSFSARGVSRPLCSAEVN